MPCAPRSPVTSCGSRVEVPMKTLHVAALLALIGAPLLAQAQETEPNDSPAPAQPVTRGSSVRASMAPFNQATASRDQDYFVLSANAGDTIFVDVDADEFGSHMNMGLTVYASDGTTMLTSNNDWDGVDPHIEYVAPTTGRYYVLTGTSLETTPWVEVPYTINFIQVKCPTTLDPEPNNTSVPATSATLGQTTNGTSHPRGCRSLLARRRCGLRPQRRHPREGHELQDLAYLAGRREDEGRRGCRNPGGVGVGR